MLLAVLSAAMLAIATANASAVIVHLGTGRAVSYEPLHSGGAQPAASPLLGGSGGQLQYHGGPVMHSNTNYTIYWAPPKAPAYPAEYQSGVNQYLEDLAHDSGGVQNVDSVATQYGDSGGEFANYSSHFGGTFVDTDPYPANGCAAATICLTDEQLRAELTSFVKAHALPTDLSHEYFLLTPPGVEDCLELKACSAGSTIPEYCAYHGSISVNGGEIVYSNDPFVTGVEGCDDGEHPTGKPSDGVLQGGLSHEHNESITDPELNAWFDSQGNENGDKCRTFEKASEFGTPLGKAPDGSRYNQIVNADLYWYQQEWSNEGSQCKQRLAPATPSVIKVAPRTGPAGGGTSVTITGTGFSGATAVKFGATAAAKYTVNSATSITAVSPAASTGLVDVTVTTSGGTSPLVSGDHFTFAAPTVTGVSPASGSRSGGTTITITGTGFALGTSTTVTFAGVSATEVDCTSISSCTAVSPARGKAGIVDVFATVAGKKSKKGRPGDQFEYL
ncbi:MAG TPA: IPT/TIG domain-containing protein [Solirubrobacteraceae bacterium]|nr:IPT/TIG domain-containing protein [Solirubrobacteraceae bacterium]